MHGIFTSAPHNGRVYVAERSRKGYSKLLWSVLPKAPTGGDVPIEARLVPFAIRRQAYRYLGKRPS
jgi:hypothetical protein